MSDQEFLKASEDAKNLKTRPNDQDLLELYALFKQATAGDNTQAKPGIFQVKEKAKYESWLSKKGEFYVVFENCCEKNAYFLNQITNIIEINFYIQV